MSQFLCDLSTCQQFTMPESGWEGRLGEMDTCICMAESLCCPPESISTLLISYFVVVISLLHRVWFFLTPGTVASQASLSMQFSRHEYWSGLPFLSPGDHPNPGIKPRSPAFQVDSLPAELPEKSLNIIERKKESEVAQLCPTLCDPMDCKLPRSSVHEIFQTRVLEWVAISFSRESSQTRDWTQVSHIVGRRFTIWATREVEHNWVVFFNNNLTFEFNPANATQCHSFNVLKNRS